MKRAVPCLASRGIGNAIVVFAVAQLGMSAPCYGQAPSLLPPPTSIASAPVIEDVPQTLRAAPDEVLSPRNRSEPVAALDRVPRLVASDPRVAASEIPSFQFQQERDRRARIEADRSPRAWGRASEQIVPAPNSNGADLNTANNIAGNSVVVEQPSAVAVRRTASAYGAIVAGPADTGEPQERMSGFWARPDVARIAPLALAFALFCAGLIVALRREQANRARINASTDTRDSHVMVFAGEKAHFAHAAEEGDSLPADLQPLPKRSVRRSIPGDDFNRIASSLPAVPTRLAPRRLIHALAGLNAELGDPPTSSPGTSGAASAG